MGGIGLEESNACDQPLTYRIGTVDDRFGLSTQDVSEAVSKAASIWGKALGCDIFKEDPNGALEIIFVYDNRQAAIDYLKKTGGSIENTTSSYNTLKSQFENLKSEYAQKYAAYVRDANAYNKQLNAYNAEKDTTYRKPKVSIEAYQKLVAQKQLLDTQIDDLKSRLEDLKKTADTLNNLVPVINDIAANHNLALVNYKNAKNDMTGEIREARYEWKNYKRSITVYFYHDHDELIRVLAHELGHAMGIKHNNNSEALMYYLNQSRSLDLAPEDIAALKTRFNR
jgi:DNA repair exonuclease SbcCD ATPase subunit